MSAFKEQTADFQHPPVLINKNICNSVFQTPCLCSYPADRGGQAHIRVTCVPPYWCSSIQTHFAELSTGSNLGGAVISAWGFPGIPRGDLHLWFRFGVTGFGSSGFWTAFKTACSLAVLVFGSDWFFFSFFALYDIHIQVLPIRAVGAFLKLVYSETICLVCVP